MKKMIIQWHIVMMIVILWVFFTIFTLMQGWGLSYQEKKFADFIASIVAIISGVVICGGAIIGGFGGIIIAGIASIIGFVITGIIVAPNGFIIPVLGIVVGSGIIVFSENYEIKAQIFENKNRLATFIPEVLIVIIVAAAVVVL